MSRITAEISASPIRPTSGIACCAPSDANPPTNSASNSARSMSRALKALKAPGRTNGASLRTSLLKSVAMSHLGAGRTDLSAVRIAARLQHPMDRRTYRAACIHVHRAIERDAIACKRAADGISEGGFRIDPGHLEDIRAEPRSGSGHFEMLRLILVVQLVPRHRGLTLDPGAETGLHRVRAPRIGQHELPDIIGEGQRARYRIVGIRLEDVRVAGDFLLQVRGPIPRRLERKIGEPLHQRCGCGSVRPRLASRQRRRKLGPDQLEETAFRGRYRGCEGDHRVLARQDNTVLAENSVGVV